MRGSRVAGRDGLVLRLFHVHVLLTRDTWQEPWHHSSQTRSCWACVAKRALLCATLRGLLWHARLRHVAMAALILGLQGLYFQLPRSSTYLHAPPVVAIACVAAG